MYFISKLLERQRRKKIGKTKFKSFNVDYAENCLKK